MKFLNFFKTTFGIIIIILVIIAIIIVSMNWTTITAWWNDETPDTETPGAVDTASDRIAFTAQTSVPVYDNNGNYIGSYIITGSPNERKKITCQRVTNPQGISGWIGDCDYVSTPGFPH